MKILKSINLQEQLQDPKFATWYKSIEDSEQVKAFLKKSYKRVEAGFVRGEDFREALYVWGKEARCPLRPRFGLYEETVILADINKQGHWKTSISPKTDLYALNCVFGALVGLKKEPSLGFPEQCYAEYALVLTFESEQVNGEGTIESLTWFKEKPNPELIPAKKRIPAHMNSFLQKARKDEIQEDKGQCAMSFPSADGKNISIEGKRSVKRGTDRREVLKRIKHIVTRKDTGIETLFVVGSLALPIVKGYRDENGDWRSWDVSSFLDMFGFPNTKKNKKNFTEIFAHYHESGYKYAYPAIVKNRLVRRERYIHLIDIIEDPVRNKHGIVECKFQFHKTINTYIERRSFIRAQDAVALMSNTVDIQAFKILAYFADKTVNEGKFFPTHFAKPKVKVYKTLEVSATFKELYHLLRLSPTGKGNARKKVGTALAVLQERGFVKQVKFLKNKVTVTLIHKLFP